MYAKNLLSIYLIYACIDHSRFWCLVVSCRHRECAENFFVITVLSACVAAKQAMNKVKALYVTDAD